MLAHKLLKLAAYIAKNRINNWAKNPIKTQENQFKQILNKGSKTLFGKDHNFDKIKNYEDFKQSVPIRDYESLKSYVELIKSGKENVLWPGKPV